jgi:hypothetical protein
LPFAKQREQIARQRQWLIDLEHLLDWRDPPATADEVTEQVDRYLSRLVVSIANSHDELDQKVVAHIEQTFRNRWWGLFTCYRVTGMPRTNNDLETFLRRIKCGQRHITGRKNVHDFIVRYGRFAAFVDHTESRELLLARLRQVSYADFAAEHQQLAIIQEQAAKRHRFRHHRASFLLQLETGWSAALAQAPVT